MPMTKSEVPLRVMPWYPETVPASRFVMLLLSPNTFCRSLFVTVFPLPTTRTSSLSLMVFFLPTITSSFSLLTSLSIPTTVESVVSVTALGASVFPTITLSTAPATEAVSRKAVNAAASAFLEILTPPDFFAVPAISETTT